MDEPHRYREYLATVEPDEKALAVQRRSALAAANTAPRWSVICANEDLSGYMATYESLEKQTYPRWEFCVAGNGLNKGFEKREGVRTAGLRRGETTVLAALRQASGNWLLFLLPGDRLRPDALFALTAAIMDGQDVDLIYGDEDHLNADGDRERPVFKPAFSPNTLLSYDYLGRMVGISRRLFEACGGVRELSPDGRYDLHVRLFELCRRCIHVSQVLLTRERPSPAPSLSGGKRVIARSLKRLDCGGYPVGGLWSGSFAVQYGLKGDPMISVIVAGIVEFATLRRLLDSIEDMTDYGRYELLLVSDGGHTPQTARYFSALTRNNAARVLSYDGVASEAAIRNFAAREAKGELLLFLGTGLAADTPDFFLAMAALAQQRSVGAVGARIITAEGTVDSAGTVVGLYGWAGGLYRGAPANATDGLQKQFTDTVRNVAAVTGDCLMVRKELFRRAGEFDRTFAQVGWDTEFCIRLRDRGFHSVYTPYATFVRDGRERARPLPTKRNLQRCIDAYRPMLVEGDPYFGPQYDYTSPIPRLAVPPVPPLAINPGTKGGV